MKLAKLALLLLAFTPYVVPAAEPAPDAPSAYTQAVKAYVDGASTELSSLKKSLKTSIKQAKPEDKAKFEPASEKLAECEKILARLKDAGPSTFDTVKSEYETARADLVKKLQP